MKFFRKKRTDFAVFKQHRRLKKKTKILKAKPYLTTKIVSWIANLIGQPRASIQLTDTLVDIGLSSQKQRLLAVKMNRAFGTSFPTRWNKNPFQEIQTVHGIVEIIRNTRHDVQPASAHKVGQHTAHSPSAHFSFSGGSQSPRHLAPKAPSSEPVKISKSTECSEAKGDLIRVWYGTNRNLANSDEGVPKFGHKTVECITWGNCEIFVPFGRRKGSLGKSLVHRVLTLDMQNKPIKLQDTQVVKQEVFFNELRKKLFEPNKKPELLVYIHGYHTSFAQAAVRAGQLGYDLGLGRENGGEMAFFSWPATASYPKSVRAYEESEKELEIFLLELARKSGACKIHILAHSLGNRLLLRSLKNISYKVEKDAGVIFDQIIVAAPDITEKMFCDLADAYRTLSRRTTLYCSDLDVPLKLSGVLYGGRRAGDKSALRPSIVPFVDTVEVPVFNLELFAHSFYAKARPVLSDMSILMAHNTDPGIPPRELKKHSRLGRIYWRIPM